MFSQKISINMIDDHLIFNRYCFHQNLSIFGFDVGVPRSLHTKHIYTKIYIFKQLIYAGKRI